MSVSRSPEVLYGDTADKSRAYAELSVQRMQAGDSWGAVHAMFASDVATLQSIILERVMIASPQPEKQFFAVASAVSGALSRYAAAPQPCQDARESVLAARRGLEGAFDKPIIKLLAERYANPDHLAGLSQPTAAEGEGAVEARLQGTPPGVYLAGRQEAAATDFAVALGLYREGYTEDAVHAAYRADMAAYEGYLLEAARAVGDRSFATVDLRWWLACDALAKIAGLPADFVGAVTLIRASLAWAVGPVEAGRLQDRFSPLPG